MLWTRFALLGFLSAAFAGCHAPAIDCGEGSFHADDTGRYCAYGVIVGGFSCPNGVPHAFVVPLPDGTGVICTDRSDGGMLPAPVCEDLGAPEGCATMAPPPAETDAGTGREPLPAAGPDCAPGFGPPTPGSLGGIRVGRYGAPGGTPLDELADGDTVTVYRDGAGDPALALALQIGPEDERSFVCYRVTIESTFSGPEGAVVEAPPVQYLAEQGGRLPGVHVPFGALPGSLDGAEVTLEIAVQSLESVQETRTLTLLLADPSS